MGWGDGGRGSPIDEALRFSVRCRKYSLTQGKENDMRHIRPQSRQRLPALAGEVTSPKQQCKQAAIENDPSPLEVIGCKLAAGLSG